MNVIYLDHNATTPRLPQVDQAMADAQREAFGNPSSQHAIGRRARQMLEDTREQIGRMLGARTSGRDADNVIFTSGGTEANNLAIFGLARAFDPDAPPGQAIVSAIEHPSVAVAFDVLERRGWRIDRLGVSADGLLDVGPLDEWLTERTRFVSLMVANNEMGVIQPVAEVARRCAALGVPMHTDAVQMIGKLPLDFRSLGASAMTVAPHKFHGPVGIGALVVREGIDLAPLLFGGFQQAGLRPGTEALAPAVGMRAALEAWQQEGPQRTARLRKLRDRLERGLVDAYPDQLVVNGAAAPRLPNTSNVALVGLDRQQLAMALDLAGVACSTGSACASGSSEPSGVLAAMGCPDSVLSASLRFSVGATTRDEEIDEALKRIAEVAGRMAAGRPKLRPAAR